MEVEYLLVSSALWVLVRGLVAYLWVGETGAFPLVVLGSLVGRAMPKSVFRGSLSADGYGCVPTLLLFNLRQPSTGAIECWVRPGLGAKVAILQRDNTE